MEIIRTEKLTKLYRSEEVQTLALNEVDLKVQEGEFLCIMGPSGCGKSTLMNILGLIDSPSQGKYFFKGQDLTKLGERQRANIRKENIGFVFQSFNLIDELTVFENVELPLIYTGTKPIARREKVEQALQKLQMMHRLNHFPSQLSGGQQQRVAVARAIVHQPSLILADEPTGNLDSGNGEEVMQMLAALNEEGTTVVMVTHSPRNAEFGHRIVRLMDGKIVAENMLRSLPSLTQVKTP